MINRGDKDKETNNNIEIPMEIDEIKGVGQSYGNINQLPEELDHQMEEEVQAQIPGTNINIPSGVKIDIPNHIK